MSILYRLVRDGNNLERIREILQSGEDPNIRNTEGDSPLHIVAFKEATSCQEVEDGLQVARELINFGANVNIRNFDKKTPLIQAVRARNSRMVELLLEANAQINHRDNNDNTALHHAVALHRLSYRRKGHISRELRTFKTLLRFNPEFNIKNVLDRTPLIFAVKNKDLLIVRDLLRHNASVNFLDRFRNSALHHALCQTVNTNVVFELVKHGGDFSIRNKEGETPIDIYIQHLHVSPSDEVEKAKKVFKVFIFFNNSVTASLKQDIEKISREKNCQLSQFIEYCINEMSHMLRDEIAPNYYVYNLALSAFSTQSVENDHVSFDVFDQVLDKLMKGRYPVYCDLIVDGICSPYLNKKFAEMVEKTGSECMNFDILYMLSFYLSHFDMLNMMLACSADNRWDQTFPYLERFNTNCTVM